MAVGREIVLGLSADFHDAAAAVLVEGKLVGAAAEERFTRQKHDPSLPVHATRWCLDEAGVTADDRVVAVFHEKPMIVWERVLTTHARVGPRGFATLRKAMPEWLRSKLWVGYRLARMLDDQGITPSEIRYSEHHQSHAAAAFYPSPYERAAILTFDGVGEWATSSIAWGAGHRIEMKREQRFPDSLGLFYSAMTAFCGFAVNDDEYKLMGLAPYGEPAYADVLRDRVINIADDGAITLDQRWFDYRAGRRMTHPRLAELLDGGQRERGAPLDQRHADIARSTQVVLEEAILATAHHAFELTGERYACLAGGVALNCVANSRLLQEGPFEDIWVQPAAGDDGSSVGAAYWSWHQIDDHPRPARSRDTMAGAALGPSYSDAEIVEWLTSAEIDFEHISDLDQLVGRVADELVAGGVVGWFRGGMEFGPRALGRRSILADPRAETIVERLNASVKGRESFRPFAPAVDARHADEWFDLHGRASPYMLFTAAVATDKRIGVANEPPGSFVDRLHVPRSLIPACTHVDGTARIQTVDEADHPDFHRLIDAFAQQTGVPVLLNTSFNRAGEPIVRSPADALRCASAAGIDLLVLENCLVRPEPVSADTP